MSATQAPSLTLSAYDAHAVRNWQIVKIAKRLLKDNVLSATQFEQAHQKFPVPFNKHNIYVCIALFFFTMMGLSFLGGIMALAIPPQSETIFVYAIIFTALAEFAVSQKRWYRQGSDNAVIYAAIGCWIASIIEAFEHFHFSVISFAVFALLSVATLRYGDPIVSFFSFLTFLTFTFLVLKQAHLPLFYLPLALAAASAATYFFATNALKREAWFYWHDVFKTLRVSGLFGVYFTCNYYAVRTLAVELDASLLSRPLPLGALFWALTAVVPVMYLFIGVKDRDRPLWIVGAVALVASVLTLRYYFHVMPIEWALVFAGGGLLSLAYFLASYLKTPKHGFLDAVLLTQVAVQAGPGPETGFEGGGGSSGGGGASGDF